MTDLFNFKNSVLDPQADAGIIQNIQKYATIAGLGGSPEYIWRSMKDYSQITDADILTAKLIPNLKVQENAFGLIFQGNTKDAPVKFMAMTGFLIRNYLDARYYPMPNLIQAVMDNNAPECRILFIPDFVTDHSTAPKSSTIASAPDWKKDLVMGLLLERQAQSHPTIIAIPDVDDAVMRAYGKAVAEFIDGNYLEVGADV